MTTALADVCSVIMGQAPTGDSYNDRGEGTPLIAGAGDFDGVRIVPKKFTTAPTKVSVEGDIILSIRASIGAKVRADGEYCLGRGVAGLRAGPRIDPGYLWHWLSHVERDLAGKGRGATFLQVNRNDIGELPIEVRPLEEQRRIATILDQVDALRTRRNAALDLFGALAGQIFREMFGGHPAVDTVADVSVRIRTGPFGSQLLHSEFVEDGVAVLGLDNVVGNEFRWAERRYITQEKYESLKRYTVAPGDVLISIMGTTGRCVVVPADIPTAINTKHICSITADTERVDPAFLRASFLWHPESRAHLRRQTKGSIMDGLNMGIIKAMPVPVPPLGLQRGFVERQQVIRAQIAARSSSAVLSDELFASLQSRAFRGEL